MWYLQRGIDRVGEHEAMDFWHVTALGVLPKMASTDRRYQSVTHPKNESRSPLGNNHATHIPITSHACYFLQCNTQFHRVDACYFLQCNTQFHRMDGSASYYSFFLACLSNNTPHPSNPGLHDTLGPIARSYPSSKRYATICINFRSPIFPLNCICRTNAHSSSE